MTGVLPGKRTERTYTEDTRVLIPREDTVVFDITKEEDFPGFSGKMTSGSPRLSSILGPRRLRSSRKSEYF